MENTEINIKQENYNYSDDDLPEIGSVIKQKSKSSSNLLNMEANNEKLEGNLNNLEENDIKAQQKRKFSHSDDVNNQKNSKNNKRYDKIQSDEKSEKINSSNGNNSNSYNNNKSLKQIILKNDKKEDFLRKIGININNLKKNSNQKNKKFVDSPVNKKNMQQEKQKNLKNQINDGENNNNINNLQLKSTGLDFSQVSLTTSEQFKNVELGQIQNEINKNDKQYLLKQQLEQKQLQQQQNLQSFDNSLNLRKVQSIQEQNEQYQQQNNNQNDTPIILLESNSNLIMSLTPTTSNNPLYLSQEENIQIKQQQNQVQKEQNVQNQDNQQNLQIIENKEQQEIKDNKNNLQQQEEYQNMVEKNIGELSRQNSYPSNIQSNLNSMVFKNKQNEIMNDIIQKAVYLKEQYQQDSQQKDRVSNKSKQSKQSNTDQNIANNQKYNMTFIEQSEEVQDTKLEILSDSTSTVNKDSNTQQQNIQDITNTKTNEDNNNLIESVSLMDDIQIDVNELQKQLQNYKGQQQNQNINQEMMLNLFMDYQKFIDIQKQFDSNPEYLQLLQQQKQSFQQQYSSNISQQNVNNVQQYNQPQQQLVQQNLQQNDYLKLPQNNQQQLSMNLQQQQLQIEQQLQYLQAQKYQQNLSINQQSQSQQQSVSLLQNDSLVHNTFNNTLNNNFTYSQQSFNNNLQHQNSQQNNQQQHNNQQYIQQQNKQVIHSNNNDNNQQQKRTKKKIFDSSIQSVQSQNQMIGSKSPNVSNQKNNQQTFMFETGNSSLLNRHNQLQNNLQQQNNQNNNEGQSQKQQITQSFQNKINQQQSLQQTVEYFKSLPWQNQLLFIQQQQSYIENLRVQNIKQQDLIEVMHSQISSQQNHSQNKNSQYISNSNNNINDSSNSNSYQYNTGSNISKQLEQINVQFNDSNFNQSEDTQIQVLQDVYLRKIFKEDIGIRIEPDFPGKKTGEIIEGCINIKVKKKVFKKINYQNQTINVNFYQINDERGWIFDVDPRDLSQLFIEIKESQIKNQITLENKKYQMGDPGRNSKSLEQAIQFGEQMQKDYENSLSFTSVGKLSCTIIIQNDTGGYIYPEEQVNQHGKLFTHPLLLPDKYFGVFLHVKEELSLYGAQSCVKYYTEVCNENKEEEEQKNQEYQDNTNKIKNEFISVQQYTVGWECNFSKKIGGENKISSEGNVCKQLMQSSNENNLLARFILKQ